MGQEIERARALLQSVTQSGLMPAGDAAGAYEDWVAGPGDQPFCRFLMTRRGVDPDALRGQLRLIAVQGLPHPEKFTHERFEDLLVAQLGIEAGMLSGKLIRSVRAVQDKKVAEGKLRRLSELLPRAGFDKSLLELLHQHLQERILLCAGCLGRYPRKDLTQMELECPRCGMQILAAALEPSGLIEVPEDQRRALLASSEFVLETRDEKVSQREERRSARLPTAEEKLEKSNPLVPVVGFLSLVVIAGGVGLVMLEADSRKGKGKVPVRLSAGTGEPTKSTPTPSGGDGVAVAPDPREVGPAPGVVTVARARAMEAELLREGKYKELLAVWRSVQPGPDDDPAATATQKDKRVAELGRRVEQVQLAEAALASEGLPAEEEEARLARLMREVPAAQPPFDRLATRLEVWRRQRRELRLGEAKERLAGAEAQASPDAKEWRRRTEDAQTAPPLLGVRLGPRVVDGVRIVSVGPRRFRLKGAEGEWAVSWEEEPALGLRVIAALARADSPADQRELLRRALHARDRNVAREAASRLGLPLDVDGVLAAAPTPLPLLDLGGGHRRMVLPVGWRSPALSAKEGTKLVARKGALVLEGEGAVALEGGAVRIQEREKKKPRDVAVTCRLGEGADRPWIGLSLRSQSDRSRTYRVTWDQQGWTLEVDFGSGGTALAKGKVAGRADREARLSYDGKNVVFSLGGLALGNTAVWTNYQDVRLSVGAAKGPLRVTDLALEGHLVAGEEHWQRERDYAALVDRKLGMVGGGGVSTTSSPPAFAPLTAEEPQELAEASVEAVEQLAKGKEELLGGRQELALQTLLELHRKEPNLVAATYYLAWLRLGAGELGAAEALCAEALRKQGTFVEALGLRALILGLAGRAAAAEREAARALEVLPDLATPRLARAWSLHRQRDRAEAPTSADVEDHLRQASVLAPGDPLVQAQIRELRSAIALEGGIRHRHVGKYHVVLSRVSKKQARQLCLLLDEQATEFVEALKLKRPSRKARAPLVTVASLESTEYEALARGGDLVSYDVFAGMILCDGLPPGDAREALARQTARAFVDRRYGGVLPAWLEVGLTLWLADQAVEGAPADLVRVLADQKPGPGDPWSELQALTRHQVDGNRLARARAWALVTLKGPRAFSGLLAAASRGDALPRPPALRAKKLDDSLAKLLKKLEGRSK